MKGRTPNPCFEAEVLLREHPVTHWAVHLPWKPSNKALTRYADAMRQTKVLDRRTNPPKVTFDGKALVKLRAKYPGDPIYAHLNEYREVEKCLGTYVDGILPFIKTTGRLGGEFNHNPITLRLAQKSPSLLNLPRFDAEEKAGIYNVVRAMYVAERGHVLSSRDYMGIEAKIVGYLAHDPVYTRLCGLDIHTFLVSHIIGEPIEAQQSDAVLKEALGALEARFKGKRQQAKKIGHASNYLATPHKAFLEEPELFGSEREARRLMDLYHGLFPSIGRWHTQTCDIVDAQGYITAPSGLRLHYTDVYAYTYRKGKDRKEKGGWERKFGEAAKEAVAGVPQHMGAFYLLAAAVRMCERYPDFQPLLRLMIHDEMFWECREEEADLWDQRVKEVMEEPCEVMPLPESWGMGEYMWVETEGKRSVASGDGGWGRWSEMR